MRLDPRTWRRGVLAARPKLRALHAGDLAQLFEPDRCELGREWLERQDGGELYVVVAEVSGAPVGRRCLNFTWHRRDDAVYCFAFTVQPRWRSRGIARQIDRHSEQVARARGFHALRCAVNTTDTPGLAWHERLGYDKIHQRVVRWHDQDGEHELDCWLMDRRWARSDGEVP